MLVAPAPPPKDASDVSDASSERRLLAISLLSVTLDCVKSESREEAAASREDSREASPEKVG